MSKCAKDISQTLLSCKNQSSPQRTILLHAESIVHTLRRSGFEAWFVGGAVRDLLLNRPFKEIDITTDANPEQIRALFPRTLAIGEAFGVICVVMDHVPFEVATYRQEHGFSDGRHPDTVQKGTLEQDVVRRDFTINGLVLNPNTGEVLDLVGGIADLKLRIVRAIGNADERFKEDYLRTLRAIRFAACLDFSLESSTLEAVRLTASGLANISRERIHAELAKICAGHAVPQGLQLLVETGLVDPLFNTAGIDDTAVCRAAGWCLDAPLLGEDVPALLATLLAAGNPGLLSTPLSPEKLDAITGEQAHNFRLANRQHSAMTEILTVATGLLSAQSNRLARRADLYRTDRFHTGLALLEAHRKFRREPLKPIAALVKERDSIPHDRLFPPRWVTGTDLKAAGLAPGPEFGKLLRELSDRIVEGNICNRDEALDWIRGQLSSLPQH